MSDIIQRLGFDAGSAITTINSLKAALDGLNQSLSGVASAVKKFNQAGGLAKNYTSATKAIDSASTALNKVKQASATHDALLGKNLGSQARAGATAIKEVGTATDEAANKTKEFTISWQTLARVVTTRLALGGFNLLLRSLKEGTAAAIDFGIRIAEIGTIAGRGTNLGDVRNELISISKATGQGLSDVAEGYYQTLSNQVGNATESMQVFSAAGKLAVATNSSLENSVNLTTAALNGWSKDASQAGEVTGKLFKTIELGRLRVGDLANSLGAVGPIASQMGVSLEETLASLANMTVKGTRATKSITQLRAIMTQMLKPTEELKTLMQDEWGVDNAEQAIKMFGGMNNVLAELDKISGGASDQMAEFFSNVRALSGVFAQTGDMDRTIDTINQINDAGEELLDWASKLVLDTPAKRAQLAFNELKISMEEAGNALIPFATGGAQAIKLLADNMGLLAAAAASFSVVALVSKLWTLNATLTTVQLTALKTKVLLAGGIGVAFLAGYAIGEGINWLLAANERMVEHIRLLKKLADAEANLINKGMTEAFEEQIKQWGKLEGKAVKYFAQLQRGYRQVEKSVKAAAATSQDFGKSQFNSLIKAQQALVTGLATAEAKAAQVSRDAHKEIVNQKTALDQKRFDWQIDRLSDISKAEAQGRRATELISKGQRLTRVARTPEDLERAKQFIALGQQQAEQAEQTASSIKHEGTQVRSVTSARQKQVAAMNALMDVSRRQSTLSKNTAARAARALADQRERLAEIKSLTAVILKGANPFDKKGNTKGLRDSARDTKAASEAWTELTNKFTQADQLKNIKLSELLDIGKIGQQLNAEARKLPALKMKLDTDYAGFMARLQAEFDKIPVEIKVFVKLQGGEILPSMTPSEMSKEFATAVETAKTMKREVIASAKAYQTLASNIERLEGLRDIDLLPGDPGTVFGKYTTGLAEIKADFKKIKELDFTPGKGAAAKVEAFFLKVSKFATDQQEITGAAGGNALGLNFSDQVADVERLAVAMANLKETIRSAVKADPGAAATGQALRNAERLDTILKSFSGEKVISFGVDQAGLTAAATETNAIATTVSTMQATAFNASLLTAEATMNRIAAIGSSTSLPVPQVQTAAHGGLIKYLSGGGFAAKGTDTVPAMLTPGEFVVNAKSSRKFYSQLVAMNAGIKPIYRAEGGDVTNNSIGDINVSVNGGPSTKQTARDIASSLRREMRRNTLSLK